jgi:hypothetical protein
MKTSGYIVQQGQRMDLTGAISRNEKTVLFEETTLVKQELWTESVLMVKNLCNQNGKTNLYYEVATSLKLPI